LSAFSASDAEGQSASGPDCTPDAAVGQQGKDQIVDVAVDVAGVDRQHDPRDARADRGAEDDAGGPAR
jgi:hypothetical protein